MDDKRSVLCADSLFVLTVFAFRSPVSVCGALAVPRRIACWQPEHGKPSPCQNVETHPGNLRAAAIEMPTARGRGGGGMWGGSQSCGRGPSWGSQASRHTPISGWCNVPVGSTSLPPFFRVNEKP
ncbi:hypothetical protein EYF80_000617 [Liparis tanakae]|uniref:Secreted protein n=1 Tax=Liparis tanakae TaxID=230148 RepID=A0A4Z2JGD7_9TELE|nr:hypothetical protein EYF80_000617 [Liparis tanakae]